MGILAHLNGGGADGLIMRVGKSTHILHVNTFDGRESQMEEYSLSAITGYNSKERKMEAAFTRTKRPTQKETWLCQRCLQRVMPPYKKLSSDLLNVHSCRFCGKLSGLVSIDKWLTKFSDDGYGFTLVDKELADKMESYTDDELDDLLKVARLVAIKRNLHGRYGDYDE